MSRSCCSVSAPRTASLTSSVSVTSSTSRPGAIPVRWMTSRWSAGGRGARARSPTGSPAPGARGGAADARACLLQHVAAERHDEARLLRQRDELERGDAAAARMVPAHERLDARRSGRWRDRRSAGTGRRARAASIARSSSALRSWRRTIESRIAGVKTAKRRLPPSLAVVHGHVGVAQQLLRVRACVPARGDADAEADVEQLLAGVDREDERLQRALGELDGAALDVDGRRTRTANSSPPRRATTSVVRDAAHAAGRRRRAAARRRPRGPSVSLTPLKSSRSMNITATSPGEPGSSASRTCWLNSERLASPVSGSWWAWC